MIFDGTAVPAKVHLHLHHHLHLHLRLHLHHHAHRAIPPPSDALVARRCSASPRLQVPPLPPPLPPHYPRLTPSLTPPLPPPYPAHFAIDNRRLFSPVNRRSHPAAWVTPPFRLERRCRDRKQILPAGGSNHAFACQANRRHNILCAIVPSPSHLLRRFDNVLRHPPSFWLLCHHRPVRPHPTITTPLFGSYSPHSFRYEADAQIARLMQTGLSPNFNWGFAL
jgi:hypothetical protein